MCGCWRVVVGSVQQQCRQQQQQLTVDVSSDESPTYLSSYMTQRTNCGSFDSPWRLVAPAGRRLRLFLLDFASHDSAASRPVTATATCQVSQIRSWHVHDWTLTGH